MTFSNANTSNPSAFTSRPADQNAAQNAATPAAPKVSRVLRLMMAIAMWLVGKMAQARTHDGAERMLKSKAIHAGIIAFLVLLAILPGTRAEKRRLWMSMFAKAKERTNAKLDKLYKAYLVWRQRKCWMWGGGFMNSALARMTDVFKGAPDGKSYDALIPD